MKSHITYSIPKKAIERLSGSDTQKSGEENSPLGNITKTHVMPTAQGLRRVHEFILQDQSARLLPKERVCLCLKRKINKSENRTVKYRADSEKAHWSNVQRCGSLWTCPVCAKRISEGRRAELSQGIEEWKRRGGSVFLMTLTFSHNKKQPLKGLLEGQKKALKRFYETTRVQAIFKELRLFGKVKSLEITYGRNGWHPHNHILMLTEFNVTEEELLKAQSELGELWIKACKKSGLNAPDMTHGIDLRDGSFAEKYVSKWGLEHEVTKGIVKTGKKESQTPFDILHKSIEGEEIFGTQAEKLFQEYGIATKGIRQLEWSRGLKKELLIDEVKDEQLTEEDTPADVQLSSVDDYTFEVLKVYQQRHTYLRALEEDYKDNTIGNGKAERLLLDLFMKEVDEQRIKPRWRVQAI